MGSSAKVGPDTYALFLNDVTKALTEVRIVSVNAPDQLSSPIETYQFDGIQQTVVFLDDETNTWFMYYRAPDSYGVKLAPAGTPDATPPTAPAGVVAKPINEQQVDLAWNPAADTETGIVLYNVFRDGVKIATVKGWNFSDTPLNEQTEHTYQISAVNYHGLEGPKSTPIKITTLMDSHSPEIVSVTTGSNPNQVRLVFNEPMEQSSAELNTTYTVNNGIIVTDAALEQDLKTVVLTTLAHVDGKYQLTIRNVKDRAKMSDSIEPNTTIDYLFTGINGLIGAWPFDEVTGETAFDLANHGNHGALTYLIKPDLVKAGPTRVPGVSEQGLQFDGTDDQVTIQGVGLLADVTSSSHTLAVWVNPELVPPGNTANDTSYSLLVRKYSGLYYVQSQKFKAEIQLSDGNRL
jgi:hypothetical protein